MLRKIVSISYLPREKVRSFEVDDDTVRIVSDMPFISLQSIKDKTSVSCSPKESDAGILYNIAVSARLLYRASDLISSTRKGCIVKVVTADGKSHVLGSYDFPLRGSVIRNLASTAKDFAGFSLSLAGNQLHDSLLLRE